MQICHEKRRFTLPNGCRRSTARARAPAHLLLRTCAGRHAAAARRCARAPLGASAACAALGVGLLRACPWGALRRAPGEGPSARRLLGRAPPRAAAWGAAPPRAAWRPRERTRGSRDRMGEMGSGVCVGMAGVVQSKKFLLLPSNLKP